MPNPIEITEKDLIDRPAGIAGIGEAAKKGGVNPLAYLKDVQASIKQFKEIMDAVRGLGINIPGLKFPGMAETEAKTQVVNTAPQPSSGQQLRPFLNLLAMRYGDITIDELMVKLKEEFGNKKISQLGRLK